MKEHFEPYLRASSLPSQALSAHSHTSHPHPHAHHTNPITAAASSALARDIPGVSKYTPLARARAGREREKGAARFEVPEYRARVEVGAVAAAGGGGGEADVEFMRALEGVGEVASLEQRWGGSWVSSLHTR